MGAAGSLFADEDPDDLLRFPTLMKVKYDASPNTGSVVISFEGVGDAGIDEKNTLYRIYRASSPIMSVQSLNHAEVAAAVPIEEIPFRDFPEQDGMCYYAVLSVIEGEELQYLVPYHNATVSAIDFAPLRC